MICVFTVCKVEQYAFAEQLGRSLPAEIQFCVGLTQGSIDTPHVATLAQLNRPELLQMAARYDEAALAAACKPFFAQYFLQQTQATHLCYFDATVQLFGSLETIVTQLDTADILLTPRLTRPMGSVAYGDEKQFLNTGLYDSGFWAIRSNDNTHRFLNWWQNRLSERAHFDLCHGMNHDQLWLNLVPVYFDNVKLVKNEGWNVGLHNLHERVITDQNPNYRVNQQTQLLFFNFRECINTTAVAKEIIEKSGAKTLVNKCLKEVNTSKSTSGFFSIYSYFNPALPRWKRWLKQALTDVIEYIGHFPLYH
jgi:hypothetical protein